MGWQYLGTIRSSAPTDADFTHTNNTQRVQRLAAVHAVNLVASANTLAITGRIGSTNAVELDTFSFSADDEYHGYTGNDIKHHIIEVGQSIVLNQTADTNYEYEIVLETAVHEKTGWNFAGVYSSAGTTTSDFTYTNNTQKLQRCSQVQIESTSGTPVITIDGLIAGNSAALESHTFAGSNALFTYVSNALVNHIIIPGETIIINENSAGTYLYTLVIENAT
tara:strand:+ start:3882 stop:4547 length:666 start_codon:yes stop_codon:yes gene_type:complete